MLKEFNEIDERVYDNWGIIKVINSDKIIVLNKRTNQDESFTLNEFKQRLNEEERLLYEEELTNKVAKKVIEILEEKHII